MDEKKIDILSEIFPPEVTLEETDFDRDRIKARAQKWVGRGGEGIPPKGDVPRLKGK